MALTPGTRLGPYEILSALGAGGMGEVYRARDTKLGRDVALKTLPASVVHDAERLARFEREARTLATLNHPHIAQIYGFEQSGDTSALVMELVEGDDLSARIADGPLPLEDALPIARQIAEALEAAHEQGIIHRDLKPANIKVRPDGTVKVLDFGLAKAMEPRAGGEAEATPTLSPTITSPAMTMRGMILGTAAYMSPEQAKGKPVDARSDIWAFGCVLYEMLTGRRAFEGEDVSDTLAAILRGEPDWARLPALPSALHTLLRRCVERDWRRRIGSMSVVRFVLDDPALWSRAGDSAAPDAREVETRVEGAVAQARRQLLLRRVIPLAALAALASVAAIVGFTRTRPTPPLAAVTRFLVTPTDGRPLRDAVRLFALSPSGDELAYLDEDRVLIRRFSEFEFTPIAATNLGMSIQAPAFSPDGEWIAYYSGGERAVKRIRVRGGAALRVCELPPLLRFSGLQWTATGIVGATGSGGVVRCNPAGGSPEQLVAAKDGETVLAAQLLPGEETVLLTIAEINAVSGRGTLWERGRIIVQTLRTGARKTVLETGSDARFVSPGHLLYTLGGVLFAVPFNVRSATLRGEAVPVIEGVRRSTSGGLLLAVSDSGALAYQPGTAETEKALRALAISDRNGTLNIVGVPHAAYTHVRVSHDGTRAAIGVDDGKHASVALYPLNGRNAVQRLTLAGNNRFPLWSPDTEWIVFQSDRNGDLGLFRQRVDGTKEAERLTTAASGEEHVPESWSPDGRHISFGVRKPSASNSSSYVLWVLTLADRKAAPFGNVASAGPTGSVFSPDGKWLAYARGSSVAAGAASDSDRGVFVQPFPATGSVYPAPRQVVDFHPVWSASGAELVYTAGAAVGQMVAVPVTHERGVTFGTAVLFPASVGDNRVAGEHRAWDILPDGRLIGMIAGTDVADRSSSTGIRVILNWFEELKQRVPLK